MLRQKYSTTQHSWNIYLDALQEYIKEFPTIKQDFINRNELLRTALEDMRDFLLYYRRQFGHLYMDDLLYKKKTIALLIDYYNDGYYLFEHYEKNDVRGTKESFIPHVTRVYWKPWEEVLQEAQQNRMKQ